MSDPRRTLLKVSRALEEREREALRIYTPQPNQEAVFRSDARRLLIRGGNRSGKTLSAAVHEADAMMGLARCGAEPKDPTGLRVLLVSLDFTLLAENIYRKLFEPGAFYYCPECMGVRHVCKCEGDWDERKREAPPLIPPRMVKETAWLDKRRGVPVKCWLRNGVVIDFRSTDQGRAKFQGIPWDRVWCDEEATNDDDIMNEIERGLIDRKGVMKISATPLAASLTMVNWSERAAQEKADNELREGDGEAMHVPYYEEVQLFTDDNLALDPLEIERFFENMGEEEEGVRRRGEFLVQQGLVYGREFDKNVHLCDTFKVPQDWTVYEIMDPGHANAFATLYWAVDPEGDHWIFDELYLRREDIPDVVRKQKALLDGGSPAIEGQHKAQRCLIDPAADQTGPGMSGKSVRSQIHEEKQRQNHASWDGGHKTYKAHNEVQAGIFAVKALLKPRAATGKPRLHVMRHLSHLMREMRRYRWPRPQPGLDLVEKKGPLKKDDHLCDCLRYGALANLQHVPPEMRPGWGANPHIRKKIEEFHKKRRDDRIKRRMNAYGVSR